jgi:hypothetical protein
MPGNISAHQVVLELFNNGRDRKIKTSVVDLIGNQHILIIVSVLHKTSTKSNLL